MKEEVPFKYQSCSVAAFSETSPHTKDLAAITAVALVDRGPEYGKA